MTGRIEPSTISTLAVVLPPRPNLGPEPWSSFWSEHGEMLALGLAVVVIVLGLYRIVRPARFRRREGSEQWPTDSASTSLAFWSDRVRDRLSSVLDVPTLASWTTEQIAGHPSLVRHLGDERVQELVGFLRTVDRAKFAEIPIAPNEEMAWLDWARSFVAEVDSTTGQAPRDPRGARSRITGK